MNEESKNNCVVNGFIISVCILCSLSFVIDYLKEYRYAINNLNRKVIAAWTIVVCLILVVSSISLIREMRKHYSFENKLFKSARSRILMILSVLVFSYLYRTAFYIWYIIQTEGDPSQKEKRNEMQYVMIGSFMYIFGEGLPIVIIFTMHYYKFVHEPNKIENKN